MSDSEQNNKEKMMNDQLEEIKEIINTDILAADVKLSMFISAAKSFKADSLLSPFPKTYIVETKLIDELVCKKYDSMTHIIDSNVLF